MLGSADEEGERLSAVEEGDSAHGARGAGYRSPALDRLRDPPRQTTPIRRIAEASRSPEPALASDQQLVEALEARLERLEQQQLALVANLHEAHAAFMHLARRVGELAGRLDASASDRPAATPH